MKPAKPLVLIALLSLFTSLGILGFQASPPRGDLLGSTRAFLAALTPEQHKLAVMTYDAPVRTDWHFIPKESRKGLILREMTEPQREQAHAVLRAALSQIGYDKAAAIMEVEALLKHLQDAGGGRGPIRDTLRYYWTIFGEPTDSSTWGLSIEGHHLSLNFVVRGGKIVSVTPMTFGTNPATIMGEYPVGPAKGTRIVDAEERLAYELLAMLGESQRTRAVVSDRPLDEVRNAGRPQPAGAEKQGIPGSALNAEQKAKLRSLIASYFSNLPAAVAESRLAELDSAGLDAVHFGWWGGHEKGQPHYFRVEGPTVLIELANTQSDSAGNPANHIHAMLRDPRSDFLLGN